MNKYQKGQSLFEVVFTLAIIALITSAMVLLATYSIKNASFSRDKSLATHYSQETIEWIRSERDKDWTVFYSHVPQNYPMKNCLATLSWPVGWSTCGEDDFIEGTVFKRELEFPTKTSDTVTVKIIISWTNNQGLHEVISFTDFTNWKAQAVQTPEPTVEPGPPNPEPFE
jgi:hypothetical protein